MNDRNESSRLTSATTRRQMMVCTAAAFGGLTLDSAHARASAEDGLSHSAEAIHQEPVFQASRKRVYEALTDAKQFEQVVRLSGVLQSMAAGAKPAEISPEVGAAFTLFGGYIVGRNVDLVPNERIVQAWRSQGWKPGDYSIVKFDLVEQGPGTKIVFDHRGFPDGQGAHLAAGWKAHYWEPLEKYLLGGK